MFLYGIAILVTIGGIYIVYINGGIGSAVLLTTLLVRPILFIGEKIKNNWKEKWHSQ